MTLNKILLLSDTTEKFATVGITHSYSLNHTKSYTHIIFSVGKSTVASQLVMLLNESAKKKKLSIKIQHIAFDNLETQKGL